MFHGPATLNLYAADMPAAIAWYTEVLGTGPYFLRPEEGPAAYAEWRIGDLETELGIIDAAYAPYPVGTPAGMVANWAVDDVQGAYARLLALGATSIEAPTARGEGFVTATVADPFGNVLGVMTNPHYQQMRSRIS